MHFVGIKRFSQQYYNAVRIFGYPDFTHKINDPRFRYGGEVDRESDTIIIGEEKIYYHSYDDSKNN